MVSVGLGNASSRPPLDLIGGLGPCARLSWARDRLRLVHVRSADVFAVAAASPPLNHSAVKLLDFVDKVPDSLDDPVPESRDGPLVEVPEEQVHLDDVPRLLKVPAVE